MTQATICILITIAVYLIGMLVIGFYYAKKNESTSDYFLGGRKLGPIVTAMSAEASDMSSYLLLGLPGLAYLSGMAEVGWTIIGLGAGTYFVWLVVARRLRRYTQVTNSITLPQFFSNRFHDKKCILTAIAAVIIVLFFIPYTAAGFAGCGKLFNALFGIDYMTAMLISALVIVGYTATGGFMAASITDLIQSIIMSFAIICVTCFAVGEAGGLGAVIDNASTLPGFLSMGATYVEKTGTSEPFDFLKIITTLSWGLGYMGMPHILLRFMAIEDEKKLKISRRIASTWVIISMAVVVLLGLAGKAMSANGLIPVLTGSASETVIVHISDLLSSFGIIPAFLAGLVLSGILACTMSTADSQLLAAASSVSENLLQETFKMKLNPRTSMMAARLTVLVIAVLGVLMAYDPNSSVFGIVSFAWAGFGAGFGPLVMCALFWKRTTLPGAIAGMVAGGAMTIIWKYLIGPLGGVFAIYELMPAFLIGLATIIAVSLMTKAPDQEIEQEFEMAKSDKVLQN